MPKFLVTGATGFLGNAVARRLLEQGHQVRVMSRAGSNRRNLQGLDVEQVEGDLSEPKSLKGLARGCAGLYHVAADYRLWVPNPEKMYSANVEGSRELIRCALDDGVERVVYTSSVATLKVSADARQSNEQSEAQLSDMIGHYKRSKFLAARAVLADVEQRGAPVVIVSPTAPVGPGDIKPTPTGKVLVDAANGKMPAYLDTGLNLAHVHDVASGHLLAYEKGRVGENYILGGEDLLLKDILAMVADLMGVKAPGLQLSPALIKPVALVSEVIARLTGREPLVPLDGVRMAEKKMFFSHAKAGRELGYHPRSARSAVEDALTWFIGHGYIKKPQRTRNP